jgi:gas vesicle protein
MPRLSRSHTVVLVTGITIGAIAGACAVLAAQPNMQAALGSLQAARAELQKATPNKGGHRERAIGFVDQAIAETRAGISYAGP